MAELVIAALLARLTVDVEKDVGQCDCKEEGSLAGRYKWWIVMERTK